MVALSQTAGSAKLSGFVFLQVEALAARPNEKQKRNRNKYFIAVCFLVDGEMSERLTANILGKDSAATQKERRWCASLFFFVESQ